MASAETERFEMLSRIDQLETDKKSLEAANARTIQENRALLDRLESLNGSVIDSETEIKNLEATLRTTQQTIRKLEGAESRASDLEGQLGVLEAEQAELHNTLVTTQAEARSAVQRWRKAERGISDLQEKLERIEREAREERDRHSDMVKRMEKQRAMEKDLNTAAGRLKGAAAARTIGDGRDGGVVSHFVRDLLSDNANLQLGIAELRELLKNSNDEIQSLREQLIFHQPAGDGGDAGAAGTLRAELDPEELDPRTPRSPRSPQIPDETAAVSQQLHIHHHYHVARPAEPKKPMKKKRQGVAPNIFTSARPFSPAGPSSPAHWRLEHRATSPGLVAHSVRDSISTIAPSTRWSVFSDQPSDFAPSSVPSSPMSHHRRISVFDQEYDSPASPTTSVDPVSPVWTKHHRSHNYDRGSRTFSIPRPLYLGNVPENEPHGEGPVSPQNQSTTKRTESGHLATGVPDQKPNFATTSSLDASADMIPPNGVLRMQMTPSFDDSFVSPRPRLHRVSSHESIMSLSGGLDIHTLKVRPGQLALRPLGSVSAEAELSVVVARPTLAKGSTDGKRGSLVIRDNLLSLPNLIASTEASSATDSEPPSAQRDSSAGGLGRIVSWRLWGGKNTAANGSASQIASENSTPARSERTRSLSPNSVSPAATESPDSSIMGITRASSGSFETPTKKQRAPPPPKDAALSPRSFGINQAGAIPGFSAFWAAHQMRGPPTQVVPRSVDTEALREGLEELAGAP